MYQVERWNNWDYPSHWMYEETFSNLEDAINYCKSRNDPNDYRVISVEWEN